MRATALGGVSVAAVLDGGLRHPSHALRPCVPTSAAPPPSSGLALTSRAPRCRRLVVCASAASPALSGGGDSGSNVGGGSGPPPRGGGGGGGSSGSSGFFHRSPIGLLVLMATYAAEHVAGREEEPQARASRGRTQEVGHLLAALTAEDLAAPVPRRVALFVEPSPFTYVSGYNTRFKNTISQMVAQGAEVLCVTTGAGRTLPRVPADAFVDPPATYAGAKVLGAPSFGCPLYWRVPLSFGATRRVLSELTAFKPDVIHVTSPGVMLFAAWAYARLLDVPLVMSYHTHVPEYLTRYHLGWLKGACWSFLRAVHSRAHVTMTVSASLAKELVQQGASHGGATFAWRKAVDTEAFHPAKRSLQARARLLQPKQQQQLQQQGADEAVDLASPLLIYVGRLAAEKKVESLHPLLSSLPSNVRLALVGDGPERQALEELFEGDAVTKGRVHFVGALTGEALWSAFASADVALMPSETETLGNVVLEAMASGVPVVAVAAGGIPDIITQPGENGFLYPPGHMDTAASQVARLLASPELRERVTHSARQEAEKWGWGPATQAILQEQYPLAMALHRAGLHRSKRGDASKSDAGGKSTRVPGRVRLVSTAAKLAALRGVSTMRTAARSRRAGKLVRRALGAVA